MEWMRRATAYEKVSSAESIDDEGVQATKPLRTKLFTHFNVLFFVVNVILLSTSVWLRSDRTSPNWLLRKTNTHTPLLDRFTFSLNAKTPNASLFNSPYSIYKADPSPEVDAAWEAIADTPVFAISKDDITKMGKDPEYAVQVPEEFGYGKDMYIAANDGQHLIHCVNEIRKYAHYDYYYYPKYGPSNNGTGLPAMHRAHRSHCIAMVLHAFTCQPSLGMATWEWMEGQETPWPDFEVTRKCVNHEEFFAWQVEKQIPRQTIAKWKWTKPIGKKEKPILPELKKIQEEGGSEEESHSGLGHDHDHDHDHEHKKHEHE